MLLLHKQQVGDFSPARCLLQKPALLAAAKHYSLVGASSSVIQEIGATVFAQNVPQFYEWLQGSARRLKSICEKDTIKKRAIQLQALINLHVSDSSCLPTHLPLLDAIHVLMVSGTPFTPQQRSQLLTDQAAPTASTSDITSKDIFVPNDGAQVLFTPVLLFEDFLSQSADTHSHFIFSYSILVFNIIISIHYAYKGYFSSFSVLCP